MRVVYRMRGLLGDATEDMVNSLDSGAGKERVLKKKVKAFFLRSNQTIE